MIVVTTLNISEILDKPVAVARYAWGDHSTTDPLSLDFVHVHFAYPDVTGRPDHLVPLTCVVNAIASQFDLDERVTDTLESLASDWNGTWSQLITAATLL